MGEGREGLLSGAWLNNYQIFGGLGKVQDQNAVY